MAGISRIEKLERFLNDQTLQRTTRAAVLAHFGWSSDYLDELLGDALQSPNAVIEHGPGGQLKCLSTEKSTWSNTGVYQDVRKAIEKSWAKRTLNSKHVRVFPGSQESRNGRGDWVRPDILMVETPAKRHVVSDPDRLHVLEVETKRSFSVQSIYQAFNSALGADFCWVFTPRIDLDNEKGRRIMRAVDALGAGLVMWDTASAAARYDTIVKASPLTSFVRPVRERKRGRKLQDERDDRRQFLTEVAGFPEKHPLIV